MERLRGLRLNRTGLIAALALLPLTPLVASVVFRSAVDSYLLSLSSMPTEFDAYLNWSRAIWTVLLMAIAVALVPAGLILMRKPNASGTWSLGLMTIALGAIGTAYAATKLTLALPTVTPFSVLLVAALSVVPVVAGVRLMRTKETTSQQALGLVAMTPGAVGLVYSAAWVYQLVTSKVELSGPIAAQIAEAVALTVAPPVVGICLLQSKRASPARTLGIVVIMLGIIGAIHRLSYVTSSHVTFEGWSASLIVDAAMVVVVPLASAIAGILLMRKRNIPVVSALAIVTIAVGVIGLTYGICVLLTTLISVPWIFYVNSIGVAVLLLLPLILALAVVPVSVGVLLIRRTYASGPWALGLFAIVLGVTGTTFSAVQLLARSSAPKSVLPIIELSLMNTAWLP